jgi:hypothetical protein
MKESISTRCSCLGVTHAPCCNNLSIYIYVYIYIYLCILTHLFKNFSLYIHIFGEIFESIDLLNEPVYDKGHFYTNSFLKK